MFVQKNVRRNYQWQKIIMLQKTVQTKIHMDPIRMRMLKMLPARISQIKIQAIKMHPVGGAYQFVAQKNGISVDQTKKIVSRLKRQPAAFKEHQIFLRWMAEKKQI